MEQEILKKIKNSYLYEGIKLLLLNFLFWPISIMMFIGLITDTDGSLIGNLFMGIINLFLVLLSVFILIQCCKSFYYFFNPYKSKVYKIYGNLESIIKEISSTTEYQDENVIISSNYLLSKHDYRSLVAFIDILGVYINVHKTNFVVDKYSIVISDKYNNTIWINYTPSQKDELNKVMIILTNKCHNAKFGYSAETLNHIRDNIESTNDVIEK